jgi:ATP-dependent protease HslVU (ClpYQ) peptidase subunit
VRLTSHPQVNASKTDPIIDEHKDKTLDELVEARIINADQRAQRLKKPQLEAQLAQYEEQLTQYKKVDEEYRARSAADKAALETTLVEKLEKEKADAIAQVTEKATADAKKSLHDNLLVLSQFLRLAAARRSEEADPTLDENMALEGVLLNVYSGDENAVSTMLKLIEGSSEVAHSVAGDELRTTCEFCIPAGIYSIS